MNGNNQEYNAEAMLDYLDGLDPRVRQKGEALFAARRVRDLGPVEDTSDFAAVVVDGGEHVAILEHDFEFGWSGTCDCEDEFDCEHACAVMLAMLRKLGISPRQSRAKPRQPAPPSPASKPAAQKPAGSMAGELTAALGRPLNAAEQRFLKGLSQTFARVQATHHLSYWDLDNLGLQTGGHSWDRLDIWPRLPKDERQFWNYLANAVLESGHSIPGFMEPVTDFASVREELAAWRRQRQIDQWRNLLAAAPPADGLAAAPRRVDLRLVLGWDGAELEWKQDSDASYRQLRLNNFQQLLLDRAHGQVELSPASEHLCSAFEIRVAHGRNPKIPYEEPGTRDLLSRLLRAPDLEALIVSADRQPLRRPTEPLRWNLSAPADGTGDYRLQLVLPDGAPLQALLCTFPGRPTLYLTPNAIHQGPLPGKDVLNPAGENVIPAPALETSAGVGFLQDHGVELPSRVRDRLQTVPMEVEIQCEIGRPYASSRSDYCYVRTEARAKDGSRQETWTGEGWQLRGRPARERKGDGIRVYDRSALAGVSQWLQPLDLRIDSFNGRQSTRITRKFPELFDTWLRSLPPEVKVELKGELATLRDGAVSGKVKLEVTETDIDWFDLKVALEVSDTTLSEEELKLLLAAKGGFVRLEDKGWRRLQFDLGEEDDARLARLGLSPRELSAEPQRLHALQLADEAARSFLPEPQFEQIHRRVEDLKARVTPEVPSVIQAELRPYQRDGFHFLAYLTANRFGGILADDMGLGKTLQAITWLVWLRQNHPTAGEAPPPTLVVCPKSVMDNWRSEAERFAPGLRVKSWPAAELEQFQERLSEADVHVLNYNQLRLLGENLVTQPWLAVVLDEGQYIKNPSSQTAQVARSLRATHRLVLTGTPIENRLLDLWSLMAFAMPGMLSSRAQFAKLYDAKDDPFARQRLAARVRPFLLRRTKAQVAADLPDRIEEDLLCEIEGDQETLYQAELKRARQMLLKVKTQKQLAKQQFHFLTSLLRLRQICCHPKLVDANSKAESAKVAALLELLEPLMEEGQKVLVFSQFTGLLALLKPEFKKRKWPLFYLAGETENRGELVREFQETEGPAGFLISLKAGGFGLNLTAASYVVLFDPWWNPAVENQAIDRTHRIGQTSTVVAYRLLIKNSIEEKIRVLQKQKKALAEDVLGEERFAQSLTLDDLRYLFAEDASQPAAT